MEPIVCPHCGGLLREEERRWGTVVLCPCGKSNAAGTVSEWATANMAHGRVSRQAAIAMRQEIADERGNCP